VSDECYASIIADYAKSKINDEYHDAFEPEGFSSVFSMGMKRCREGAEIASEWCSYYGQKLVDLITDLLNRLGSAIFTFLYQADWKLRMALEDLPDWLHKFLPSGYIELGLIPLLAIIACLGAVMVGFGLKKIYDNYQIRANEQMKRDMEAACSRVAEVYKDFPARIRNKYKPQGTRLTSIRKFVKLIEVCENDGSTVISHGVVSGNKILLPFHLEVGIGTRINIYQSLEHFENGHIEAEKVRLTQPTPFPTVDLAVWVMDGSVPLYKICRNLFISDDYKENDLLLVNSMGMVEVKTFLTIKPNMESVSYEGYTVKRDKETKDNPTGLIKVPGNVTHEPWAGLISPLSGEGMCGTILASEAGGIVAFHVAGDGEEGFMVKPYGKTRTLIREAMIDRATGCEFDIDDEVIPGFSGVRLRYDEGQITPSQVNTETTLEKTAFHTDYNPDMARLMNDLSKSGLNVYRKIPPNFRAAGPQKTLLEKISKKTFSHQGDVTQSELDFIKSYIHTLIPTFTHISDEDTAFGNDFIGPLNKDSSNGYGWDKEKATYFDFENKTITKEGEDMIASLENNVIQDLTYLPRYFMCRETFKDELRKETKADEPRTFRVMPLPHIFWTKKICAELIPHFKANLHKTGCGIGMNPYHDFDKIYERLRHCEITGDIDFAKWDGSVVEAIMHTISDVLLEKYTGEYDEILRFLLETMRRSFVLVGDALYATTHGLPSGTWLTLLMNCLINKSLTALTVFRNKHDATVKDVEDIVDYVVGDDKIFGVPKRLAKVFNLKTMAKVASDLGMTCTNGDKTPITAESQPLEKLSFVKRNFFYHVELGRIVGALDVSTLLNTLQWMDRTKDRTEVMEGKMRSVQVEAYLHGRGIYDAFVRVMRKHDYTRALFSEEQVKEILRDPTGYEEVMLGLGKDLSFIKQ